MVSVLLYSPQPILAAGFRQVIESDAKLKFAGVCTAIESALEFARSGSIGLLVLDLNPTLGIGRLAELRRCAPECNLLLWAHSISLDLAHHAREIGVRGILRKDAPFDLVLRCMHKILEGELWFERDLLNSLLESKSVRLSPRERQLMVHVSRGLSNKQIAATLFIAEATVKVYLSKLFRKVGVRDRYELALYGLRNVMDMGSTTAGAGEQMMCPRSVIVPRSAASEEYEDLLEIS